MTGRVRTDQEIVQDALSYRRLPPAPVRQQALAALWRLVEARDTAQRRYGYRGHALNHLKELLAAAEAERDAAQREADIQLGEKLAAQITLKAVTDSLCLPLAELGNGWTEATAKILARIEEIVDEADRLAAERDTAIQERDELQERLDWVGSLNKGLNEAHTAVCEEANVLRARLERVEAALQTLADHSAENGIDAHFMREFARAALSDVTPPPKHTVDWAHHGPAAGAVDE